ncbi:PHP domain-containing protein [Myxosarcina sp. GI1(2024)]
MLELHSHTTYSDGILTPRELIATAANAGVKALAITDHDTIAGWDEAIAAAREYQIEIVPGIELSTVHNRRSLHLLGYYPQPELLAESLVEQIAGRKQRANKILAILADMGYPLKLPETPDNMAVSRPHIARAMVEAGYVNSTKEAFDRFIGDERPAYVHYEKFSTLEGIALLRTCGAVPVWAHPYLFRGGEVEAVLPELVAAGLLGVEVYHPYHSPTKINKLRQFCRDNNLLITGGVDYHGFSSGKLGSEKFRLNRFRLPLTLLESLKQAAAELSENL